MFGSETFIVRIAEDAMAPRVRDGDYVWIDPDEPAVDRRFVAVRDPARGGETVVRQLVERDGRRILRAFDERRQPHPDRARAVRPVAPARAHYVALPGDDVLTIGLDRAIMPIAEKGD